MPVSLASLGMSLDNTDVDNPVLQIPYDAISSSVSWDVPPTEAKGIDPWLVATLQKIANDNPSNTSNNGVTVSQPSKAFGFRNNTQVLAYTYTVTVYANDTNPATPDGDFI